MPHHYYSNPQLPRITRNLSRAILGSAQDDRAIAGARYDDARALGKERQNEFINTLVENPGLARHFAAKQMGVTPDELDAIAGDSLGAFSGRFFGGGNPQQLTQGISNALMTQPRIQAEQALASQRTASAGASDSLAGKYDAEARGAGADSDVKQQRRDAFAGFPDNAMIADIVLRSQNIDPNKATVEQRSNAAQLGIAALTGTGSTAKGLIEALGISSKTPIQIQQEEQELEKDKQEVLTEKQETKIKQTKVQEVESRIKKIEEETRKAEQETAGQKIKNSNDALRQIGISLDNSAKLVKVRQEKEKLLTLEIEKLTAQHGADSAEAFAAQRLEVTNRVKLEQELVKIKILNERKEGLAKRQNLAAKTRGDRAKSTLAENLIQPKTDEATAKSQLAQNLVQPKTDEAKAKSRLAQNLVQPKTDEATAKSQLAQNLVKPKTAEATSKASEAGSKSRLAESLVQPKIDEQTAKSQLAQNLVEPKTEEAKEKVKSAKALTRSRDRSNIKTSSGGKPTGVSKKQYEDYQTQFTAKRDELGGDYMEIPEVVRKNIRKNSGESFRKAFSGREGDTGKDFMGSLISATPELQSPAVYIDTGFAGDDVSDFAVPGNLYQEYKSALDVYQSDPEASRQQVRDINEKLKKLGYEQKQITYILKKLGNE